MITIHLNGYYDADYQVYDNDFPARLIEMTTKFLKSKSYRLEKIIDQNYIFTLIDPTNDISKDTTTLVAKSAKQEYGI